MHDPINVIAAFFYNEELTSPPFLKPYQIWTAAIVRVWIVHNFTSLEIFTCFKICRVSEPYWTDRNLLENSHTARILMWSFMNKSWSSYGHFATSTSDTVPKTTCLSGYLMSLPYRQSSPPLSSWFCWFCDSWYHVTIELSSLSKWVAECDRLNTSFELGGSTDYSNSRTPVLTYRWTGR